MKGDFSRLRDNRRKGYSGVYMQQGRVLLDSDWNEQAALMQEAVRLLARDLFGPHGGPGKEPGFKISKVDGKYKIGAGRYYVNGYMVENPAEREVGDEDILTAAGPQWLAYLDVWEDYVAPEQDGGLVEVALGGPDTCGRGKIMWKVRVGRELKKDDILNMKPTGGGLMSAFTDGKPQPDELCVISPDHQYRGIENQLYRVEIHKGGEAGGGAAYKWSRDNGSLVYPVLGHGKDKTFELARLGRDKISSLSEGGWVEYVNDSLSAGVMAKVEEIDKDNNRVTLAFADGQPPAFNENLHPLLRRWDHSAKAEDGGCVKLEEDKPKALEDGINIRFAKIEPGATYRAGDYWLIPARVATGDVDWPEVADAPAALPPRGPLHSYAPLLLLYGGAETDCRVRCEMTRTEMNGP